MSEARPRPNRLLRLLVPLAIVLGGVGIFYLYVVGTPAKPATVPPASTQQADATAKPATGDAATQAVPTSPDEPESLGVSGPDAAAAPQMSAPIGALRARRVQTGEFSPLGELTPKADGGKYEMQLEFSPFGAGLSRLRLANHFEHVDRKEHETIQRFYALEGSERIGATPLAAAFVNINGQDVDLSIDLDQPGTTFWKQTAPGTFEAVIVERGEGETEREIARITRRYVLTPGSYEVLLSQELENLSGRELTVVWNQYGPADLPLGLIRYGGDVRRVRFGYVLPKEADPERVVLGDKYRVAHDSALGKPTGTTPAGSPKWDPKVLWPDAASQQDRLSLAWAGMTSRYFAVAMHPAPGAAGTELSKVAGAEKSFALVERVDRLAVPAPVDPNATGRTSPGVMILRVSSPKLKVAPASKADLSMLVYAGPLSKKYIQAEPAAEFFGLERMVIYTFGGPCAFCTFQPVALFLRWFLGFLHDNILFDWALAIMALVVCVRTILHPVTRWSQLSMIRFSKQMQAFAPKQKAIQEKYKNDPAKMREEITKLMREGHVEYTAAARGCLPPFLQTPIWIALYAMIFFTFELRHEGAFFGVVQWLTNNRWSFLADLAEPDNFINFNDWFGWSGFSIPFISSLMGPIQGLNILPLLLGVVFYIQQKYIQPPSTGQMTPEQEQQQKIMKVMTVVMFPVFMYNAPAALSLYFMVNSTLGILESKWIRSHADELEKRAAHIAATGGAPQLDRKGRNKTQARPGLFARIQAEVERRQKLIEEQKRQAARKNRKP